MGAKQASVFLSVLGRESQFVNAIKTSVGQEIYKDVLTSAENLLYNILYEKSNNEEMDRAELRAYLNIIGKWNTRLDNYYANSKKFDKLTEEKNGR
jgi:indole-3-glycerol phosphate synthase